MRTPAQRTTVILPPAQALRHSVRALDDRAERVADVQTAGELRATGDVLRLLAEVASPTMVREVEVSGR